MTFDPLTALFDAGKIAIERLWPDPEKRAEEIRKLEALKQKGEIAAINAQVQLLLGQLTVDKAEARSKSLFVAGWRPWIGWVGGLALAYQFILYPLLCWAWAISNALAENPTETIPPPVLETGALFSMITAMLGIGAMRSFDKTHGTQTDKLR
ncbi:holin family protein [Microbulbifer spongiae]|uniref:Holin family protein n=1 Tax=Microbulbifer spongiae TaxID=2944933 RepID=A0ABY9EBW1_9GAMM|nr:holin family protein [Microbulbifer sp. MI-G]WKD48949.1 holin family protein [Microbulbifer sp. MI-G]